MAFSGNFMCTSFKQELLTGSHDFTNGNDVFKLALYDNNASFTAATTAYTPQMRFQRLVLTAQGEGHLQT